MQKYQDVQLGGFAVNNAVGNVAETSHCLHHEDRNSLDGFYVGIENSVRFQLFSSSKAHQYAGVL